MRILALPHAFLVRPVICILDIVPWSLRGLSVDRHLEQRKKIGHPVPAFDPDMVGVQESNLLPAFETYKL